jgi:hypothetical protein
VSNAPKPASRTLIENLTEEELTARLARLRTEAGNWLPILDEDDIEQAIEDAADRIVDRRRNLP